MFISSILTEKGSSGRSALAHHAHTGTSAENKETNLVIQAENILTIDYIDYYDVVPVIAFLTLISIKQIFPAQKKNLSFS